MIVYKTANMHLASLLLTELKSVTIDRVEVEGNSVTFYIKYHKNEHTKVSELSKDFKFGELESNITNFVSVANDIVYLTQLVREGKDWKNYNFKSKKLRAN